MTDDCPPTTDHRRWEKEHQGCETHMRTLNENALDDLGYQGLMLVAIVISRCASVVSGRWSVVCKGYGAPAWRL